MENPKIRFGYASLNVSLRDDGIFVSHTTRTAIVERLNAESPRKGIRLLKHLFNKNLDDLLTILKWNISRGILFYRIGSEIAPHITNAQLIPESRRENYKNLLYKLDSFSVKLAEIGKFAEENGMRLTMHPCPYYSLGTPDKNTIREARRVLWFHAQFLDAMNLNQNSVVVVHGGGIYENKFATMQKWIKRYNKLPLQIKNRLALENDEKLYSISDILTLSRSVIPPGSPDSKKQVYKIPIVFDLHHYYLYNQTILRKKESGELLLRQPEIEDIIQPIINSWSGRIPKMHVSDERPGAHFGAHDDYVKSIPKVILQIPAHYNIGLDIMVEAKMKELAALKLTKKYKKYT